jgi:hypothetical protein
MATGRGRKRVRCSGKQDGTKEAEMDTQSVPDSWVGRRVEAVVVRPINPDQPGFSTSLTALTYEGLLEEVNDRGIVASLSSEAEVLAANTFYPWGGVLSLRLIE